MENWVRYIDTLIGYYTSINPKKLSDEEWAQTFKQIMNIRKEEAGKKA